VTVSLSLLFEAPTSLLLLFEAPQSLSLLLFNRLLNNRSAVK
jgi:hypothetical protein